MPGYEQLSFFAAPIAARREVHVDVPRADIAGRRLIEVALPSKLISVQGTAERYSHGKSPHSMHVWWARRPLSSMRALVFASLATISYEEDVPHLLSLCCQLAHFEPILKSDVDAGRSVLGSQKSVLDMFGGGGSIPLEAARLGCRAVSVELNPLAVFVQRTLLNYSQGVDNLAGMVRSYGMELIQRLSADTGDLFPLRGQGAIAYFWVRAVVCQNPGCQAILPVTNLIPLRSRAGQNTYALFGVGPDSPFPYWRIVSGGPLPREVRSAGLTICPVCACGTNGRDSSGGSGAFHLMPVARCMARSTGKQYSLHHGDEIPYDALIARELSIIGEHLPMTELPRWSGIVNPTVYGITKHKDLLTPRQTIVLLRLVRGLRDLYKQVEADRGRRAARAVVACLSGLMDQLVDWNSSFSVWLATNEQVGRSLAGPGLPMQWAFAEVDPCSRGPANLWDKVERIANACHGLPTFDVEPLIISGTATESALPDSSVDAIVTDPPYADNLYYSVLSECIYTWKRLGLHSVFPDDFSSPTVPTEQEIVASSKRRGDSRKAMEFYRDGLRSALSEGYRVLKPHGILSFIFTHSTLDGWVSAFFAILNARFNITACWPFCIERKARPRGLADGAIHASCVIVAVKEEDRAEAVAPQHVEARLADLRTTLESDGWSASEIGLASFVQRTAWALSGSDIGSLPLEMIRSIVEECYWNTRRTVPDFRLKVRKSL